MFEQSLLSRRGEVRTGWSFVLSVLLQSGLFTLAVLVPLAHPAVLPQAARLAGIRIAPPPAKAAEPTVARNLAPRQSAPRGARPAGFYQPSRIPAKVAMLVEPADPPPPGGVDYGIPGTQAPWGMASEGKFSPLLPPTAPPPPPPPPTKPGPKPVIRIQQGGNVQEARLVHRVIPAYPPLARQTRIEGKVVFTAVIGTDGSILQLKMASGHPLLAAAAADAVRQWRYRPTLLNGEPVEVVTVIEVNFKLNQ